MLQDNINKYYNDKDLNCAETMLAAGNAEYELGLPEDIYRVISGFGGGLMCERDCGALCGSIAVLSKLLVGDRAHSNDTFKKKIAEFVTRFEQELGSLNCAKLKEMYRNEEEVCMPVLSRAGKLLEDYLKELQEKENETSEVEK